MPEERTYSIGGVEITAKEAIGRTLFRPRSSWPYKITGFDDKHEEVVLDNGPCCVSYHALRSCRLGEPEHRVA